MERTDNADRRLEPGRLVIPMLRHWNVEFREGHSVSRIERRFERRPVAVERRRPAS